MLRAKALFSNVADTPEELSFEVGDVLTVVELDVAGAAGWWLCSLDGRTGIAPGNRLRPLPSSAAGGAPIGRHLPPPPPHSQVNVPYKSGNMYVYDSPRNIAQDYDLPPAHYMDLKDSSSRVSGQADDQTDYDVPPPVDPAAGKARYTSNNFGALYDSPPSRLNSGQKWYDVPTSVGMEAEHLSLSNRSSVLSINSNDSRSSMASLRSGSSPSTSARSSAEVSFRGDIYDVPRGAAGDVGRAGAAAEAAAKLGRSRQLCAALAADRDSFLEDYSVPRSATAVSSASESNTSISDTSAKAASPAAAAKVSSVKETSQDLYDIPRNQQTDEGCDYDVPVQSHSIASQQPAAVNAAASENRQVSQPDVFHRQIVAKHDAILRCVERLSELAKKEVRGDKKHWCSLVTTTGLSLRTSLKELLEFGKIAESRSDSYIASRLCQHCEPLSAIYTNISQCLETLLIMSPKVNEARSFGSQELTNLTELVVRLQPLVNELCVFLHSNASDICRLSADQKPSVASSSPIVGRRQAPAVLPKPNVSQRSTAADVQLRPLPLPPTSNTITPPNVSSTESATWTYDDYDYISIAREAENNLDQQPVTGPPAFEHLQRTPSTHPPPTDPSKRCAVVNGMVEKLAALSTADCSLMMQYSVEMRAQTSTVETAVGEFSQLAASDSVTPEAFVQMSKHVVLTGHKLVYIADMIARHVTDDDVCNCIASAANALCDCLKSVVVATKEAALAVPCSGSLRMRAVDSARSAAVACIQLCTVIDSCTTAA